MTQPFSPVSAGQPFRPSAVEWNQLGETVRTVQESRSIFRPGPLLPTESTASDNTGGGTGGGGCSCCDCTQCLNMCTQNATDVIQTCSACTVAPKRFTVNLGAVLGVQNFVYVSGCTWATANFTVYYVYPTGGGGSTAGVYKGTFVEAGASSTLTITYVSGTDTLKLSTARQLSWKPDPDKPWSCICNMTMIPAVSPEKFPPNLFAPCEACVAPVSAPAQSTCDYLTSLKLCVATITMAAVDFSASGGITDCESSALTDNLLKSIDAEIAIPCCFGLIGDVVAGIQTETRYHTCVTSGWQMLVSVLICVNTSDGTISAVISIEQTNGSRINYFVGHYASGTISVGVNTLHYVSSTATTTTGGAPTSITDASWPGTLTVKASHCVFGDTNTDYGYGCGGGSTDCTGLCPAVSAVGSSPTGFVWTFTGAPASNCTGASCICQTIPQITALFGYPPSLGATAEAPCVNS